MRRGSFDNGLVALVLLFLGWFPVTAFAQVPIEFSWKSAPTILPERYYHTATMLQDNRLLVTGGRRGYDPLRTVRVFDPSANNGIGTWISFPDMTNRRERHQATVLPIGGVLISGGLDGVPIRGCELIDPATAQIQKLPDLLDARYEHTATYLSAGKVLAVGSKDYDRGLPTCEIFESLEVAKAGDPRWRWRRTGSLNFGRGKHRAVKLRDGRILVIGGVHNYVPTATCETFDPRTEVWTQVASMFLAREGHTATLLPDGKVLVIGGDIGGEEISSCELFDPSANGGYGKWNLLPATNFGRKNHTATLINGRFIVITGAWRTGQGDRSTEIMDTWRTSPHWYIGPSMLVDRSNHSATLLPDGRLLLVGGELFGNQEATGACDISEKTLDVKEMASPAAFSIVSIAPNPFTSWTSITISIPGNTPFSLTIHDVLGRIIRTLDPGTGSQGTYVLGWDGRDDAGVPVPAGLYYCSLRSAEGATTLPLQYVK
ncbi:MAG: T9SS type A sorting domain-containing protein [Bacteroidetes bacterium]|nr:T9SS type A sorting domain-containing protein [Bacteroidota bacterium]